MANTLQAKKRVRQSIKKNIHNSSQRSSYRTAIKNVRKFIASGNKEITLISYKKAISKIDIIANKKIIHKNKAARQKRKLYKVIKELNFIS